MTERTRSIGRRATGALACAAAVLFAACGGGEEAEQPAVAEGPAQVGPAPVGACDAAAITPQLVALGDSIFHGQAAGGICYTCHGQQAAGGPLAPNLTDQQWIYGGGSLDTIVRIVNQGVLQPQQFQSPMPPFAGTLTDPQICAVASYVYSLTHPVPGA